MFIHRFFRGLLLVICSQIPLLAFFVYLLSMGVGITDFGKLAGSMRPDPNEFAVLLNTQEKKLTEQTLGEVDTLSFKITQLETRLNDLSRIGPAWDKFIADGGLNSVASFSGDLKYLDGQILSLDKRIAAAEDAVASRLAEMSQKLEDMQAEVSARNGEADASNNQKLDELLRLYPTLYAPRPERKPTAELRFAEGDWEVDHPARVILDKVVRIINESGSKESISIYGFTVKQGSLNFSMALADKRARAVAESLRKKGIKNPIKIFVVPEYNTRDTRDKAAAERNHAVHIYVDDPSKKVSDVKEKP